MHPFQKHREDRTSKARVKRILKADGGSIDSEIDISDGTGGGYSLPHVMQTEKSLNDADEMKTGKRFSDNGSRIPGRQKARNDTYMDSLKRK